MSNPDPRLINWALVLRTYNRPDMLARCIRLAVAQTEPPSEVIVIDASDGWTTSRDAIFAELATTHPSIRWVYEKARVKSMTHQHDQGIRLATADVLFLIDDDSLLYPDAAAEVMRIYRSAPAGTVSAVGIREVRMAPDRPSPAVEPPVAPGRSGLIGSLRRRFDRASINFLPYEGWRTIPPLSAELGGLADPTPFLKGFQMTAWRESALRSPPSTCIFIGLHDDLDFTYRLGRLGIVALSRHARLFHAMEMTGRRSRRTHGIFKVLNMAVLLRRHAPDRPGLRGYLAKRLVLEFGADLLGRRWTFPQFRGAWRGILLMRQLRRVPDHELEAWSERVTRREMVMKSADSKARSKDFA